MDTKEKTWWLQVKEDESRLVKVRLLNRDKDFVTMETVGEIGRLRNVWMLPVWDFNITWRTWNGVPTAKQLRQEWKALGSRD